MLFERHPTNEALIARLAALNVQGYRFDAIAIDTATKSGKMPAVLAWKDGAETIRLCHYEMEAPWFPKATAANENAQSLIRQATANSGEPAPVADPAPETLNGFFDTLAIVSIFAIAFGFLAMPECKSEDSPACVWTDPDTGTKYINSTEQDK